MTLNEDTLRFIHRHGTDDVRTLALQARKFPLVDMPAAITQIAGRQAASEKVPTWAQTEGILYPAHLSLEQCSSELTARYKAEIISNLREAEQQVAEAADLSIPATTRSVPASTLADLTGGFGIDCAFLAPSSGRRLT